MPREKTIKPTVTAERLRELLHYDPETGKFRWINPRRGIRAGSVAGTHNSDGYWEIKIDRRSYRAHRLAFPYMTGEWPAEQVDHINMTRDDNRWANLREATQAENCRNCPRPRSNTSGIKGVSWHGFVGRWRALIYIDGRQIFLGHFDTAEAAAAAYAAASKKLHGEFGRAS